MENNNSSIEDLIEKTASVHLGRTSDGKTMTRYETPTEIDKSLLVGIPRSLNRSQYDLQGDEFEGVDTWNAYEFSCLLDSGFPLSGWLRWSYESSSLNIVESKSAKLYLNSFNMAKMGSTVDEAYNNIIDIVTEDLSEVLELEHVGALGVHLFLDTSLESKNRNMFLTSTIRAEPIVGTYVPLEEIVDVENVVFDKYKEDPNILEVISCNNMKTVKYRSNSLRSNCRVTNQPDWGDVYILIEGNKLVTPESLLQYIVSMRSENHFHEEICECIYKRLSDLLSPENLMVACLYTRRGGIDINPVRASSMNLLYNNPIADSSIMTTKTMRQ